jgi:hypothetical protein
MVTRVFLKQRRARYGQVAMSDLETQLMYTHKLVSSRGRTLAVQYFNPTSFTYA